VAAQAPTSKGPVESLRALGSTVAALAATRAELFAVELREETERRKEILALGAVAAVFLLLGLLLLALFVIIVFWDTHRVAAAGIVTLAYLGIGVLTGLNMRAKARNSPPPFEATRAEFANDLNVLRSGHE
jgi:uncharacterized membrane protein YqjE